MSCTSRSSAPPTASRHRRGFAEPSRKSWLANVRPKVSCDRLPCDVGVRGRRRVSRLYFCFKQYSLRRALPEFHRPVLARVVWVDAEAVGDGQVDVFGKMRVWVFVYENG